MIGKFMPLALCAAASSVVAAPVAITNATVCSGLPGQPCVAGTTLVIDGGRIVSIGAAVPAGAQVIDGTGKYVTPGLIDGYSSLGQLEIEAERNSSDTTAREAPFAAALDAQWSINPASSGMAIARLGGVTRAISLPEPSRSLFGGFGAIVDTGGGPSTLVRPRAFMVADLGQDGAESSGGSRAASYLTFTNALTEAAQLAAGNRTSVSPARDALTNRPDAQALAGVVTGAVPLVVRVHRAADIRNVLQLTRPFPRLKLVLAGAEEGWQVADALAQARVPVILGSFDNLPDSFEKLAATMANAARLRRAGVTVALGSFDQQQNTRLMNQFAGNLMALPGADALSAADALALITSGPAAAFGMSDVGVIGVGKRADIVIWDGPPLETMSAPVAVMIGGVAQPMVSRQTLLRDRYRTLTGDQPFQYRK